MMRPLDAVGVLSSIAFGNLFASRTKTLIVGGIICFGSFLVVVGTSMLDSVDRAMSRSIVGSVAGHIQVYSSESTGDLDVMGGFSFDADSIEPLPDFGPIRETLLAVPNVAEVVPMGINNSQVVSGNTLDLVLGRLRQLSVEKQEGDSSPALETAYAATKDHVRQMVQVLGSDIQNARQLLDEGSSVAEDASDVSRAMAPEFWATFDDEPLLALEFLENRIAPLATDADILFLRYVGTDPAQFAQSFDRMTIVRGEAIPRGQRGFLFSNYVYEEQIKLKTARNLDKIRDGRSNLGVKIAADPELTRLARENASLVKEILLQLDAPKTDLFRSKLQALMRSEEASVGTLLESFFAVTDENFDQRYAFFYDQLVPSLELYRVRIGDTLTIKAFTRSGYVQSANLKVYGTFSFNGLEKSPQAGSLNLMDLVSFRELYGFMTPDRLAEIAAIRANARAREVKPADAERELFGTRVQPDGPELDVNDGPAIDIDAELARLAGTGAARGRDAYDPGQLQQGLALLLGQAVLLEDALPVSVGGAGRVGGLRGEGGGVVVLGHGVLVAESAVLGRTFGCDILECDGAVERRLVDAEARLAIGAQALLEAS